MCLSGKKVAEGSCFPVVFAYIWQQITKKYNYGCNLYGTDGKADVGYGLGRSDRYRA